MSEKDPQEWSEFFSGAMDKLNGLLSSRRDERIRRDATPAQKLLEMRQSVGRGIRTRIFLDSEFWREDLEPFLRGEATLKPWAPGDPVPLEEVSMRHLYNSGKVFILAAMIKRFGKWIEEADAASKSLAEEKNKVLR